MSDDDGRHVGVTYFALMSQNEDFGFLSEREKRIYAAGKIAALAVLRAQVEALGHTNICSIQLRSPKYRQCTCFQKDVLTLIDGGTDG